MSPAVALLVVRGLLAVGLYAFLAVVLVTLWRDLRHAGAVYAVPAAHLVRLDRGAQTRVRFSLGEVNLLGRALGNTITIEDATVSAHHARLSRHAGQWVLEDLGSRNGTRVNGIGLEGMLVVTYGDEIQIGEVRLGLRAGLADSEAAPSGVVPGSAPPASDE